MNITIGELIHSHPVLASDSRGLLVLLNLIRPTRRSLDHNEAVSFGEALVVWAELEISARRAVEHDHLLLIIQIFGEELLKIGRTLEQQIDDSVARPRRFHVAFADRRIVTLTGVDFMLDLQEAATKPYARFSFLEGITYDLTAMALRGVRALKRSKESTDGAHTDAGTTADSAGSADLRNDDARLGV